MSVVADFFKDIVSLFMIGAKGKEARERRRKLRAVRLNIQSNDFSRFYRRKTREVTLSLARFFQDLNTLFQADAPLLRKAETTIALRRIVIDYFHSPYGREIIRGLESESILEAGKTLAPEELTDNCEADIALLNKVFNKAWIDRVDLYYNRLLQFIWILTFDYQRLLGKIDRTKSIAALAEDLKDFLALQFDMGEYKDWKFYLDMLLRYEGGLKLDRKAFMRMVFELNAVLKSNILTLALWDAEVMPLTEVRRVVSAEHIAQAYCDEIIRAAREALREALCDSKTIQINALMKTIFGVLHLDPDESIAAHYIDRDNKTYLDSCGVQFSHTQSFFVISAFCRRYFSDIKMLCNIFLLQADWAQRSFPTELSDYLEKITIAIENMETFDGGLSDTAVKGDKLRSLVKNSNGVRGASSQLAVYISAINMEAAACINACLQGIRPLAKFLELLYEDRKGSGLRYMSNPDNFNDILRDSELGLEECVTKLRATSALVSMLLENENGAPPSLSQAAV